MKTNVSFTTRTNVQPTIQLSNVPFFAKRWIVEPNAKHAICYLLLFLLPLFAQAFHIVGGEITYECLTGNNYQIKLTVYRDCYCISCAEFDSPAFIAVYNNTTGDYEKLSLPLPTPQAVLPPDIICAETLPDVCVHQAEYTINVNLPPTPEGYTLVYQRYSRNETIVNLTNPSQTGSSYTAIIPPAADATCNDSPTFNSFPPTVICAGIPIHIDQSASDANGDSLVYELCDPLIGGSDVCPQPGNVDTGCPDIPPPPYDTVDWAPGYSATNPLGGSDPLTIDPQTGLLTGIAPELGQYVVGICVSEYRNGVFINQIRRDFQLNVADCIAILAGAEADSISAEGDYYIVDCSDGFTVQFTNTSIGGSTYHWDFGDLTATDDISTLVNPSYAYPDTGTYHVQLIAYGSDTDCLDTANIVLKLYPTLTPAFSYVSQCADTPIPFTDFSTTTYGQITSWHWTFDDGSESNQQNTSFQYTTGGVHNTTLTVTTDLGCEESITQPVLVYAMPDADFDVTTICPGVPVSFTDQTSGGAPTTWQWDFGDPASPPNSSTDQNTTHTYNMPGAYSATLSVTTINGCTDIQTLPFTVYNYFTADAGPNGETCIGTPIQLAASNEYDWFLYEWFPNVDMQDDSSRTPTVSPLLTTTYTVTISDPNGCSDTDNVTVIARPSPTVAIAADTTVCEGSSGILNGIVSGDVVSYVWSGNDLNNSSSLNVSVSPTLDQTIYTLSVLNQFNCPNSDSIALYIVRPIIAAALGDAEICEGDTVWLSASGGDFYSWQPTTGLNNAYTDSTMATPSSDVTYVVTASNECFEDTASVHIIVHPLPDSYLEEMITINVGESATLNTMSNNVSTYSYSWIPDININDISTPSPVVSPLYTTNYLVTITSPIGCAITDSVLVNVTNIFQLIVPNAFSPNEDGINDLFTIISSKGVKAIKSFRVYNRWGQLVFDGGSDVLATWDGTLKGLRQEIGTYAFYIEAITFLDEIYIEKGNLTLIR